MSNEPTEIQEVEPNNSITMGTSIQEAKEQFHEYQQLREELATEDDIVKISGKEHPTKSFVRKVSRFFNLSCEITEDEAIEVGGEIIGWKASARATHIGTGQYQEADGSCEMSEKSKDQQTIHNVRAHAITRAKNRAILDLVGFGEVSAEEINSTHHGGNNAQSNTGEPTVPFGNSEGEPISEAPTSDLKRIVGKLDVDHEKFGDQNKKLKQAIQDELNKREGPGGQENISEETEAELFKLGDEHNIHEDDIVLMAESIFDTKFNNLTEHQGQQLIDRLEKADQEKLDQFLADLKGEDDEKKEKDENELTPEGERADDVF